LQEVRGGPAGPREGLLRVAVLVNRAAGTAGSGKVTPEQVEEALRAAGVEAAVELVEGEETTERARAALRSGVDAVVAGGGDGTINCVAGVLAGTATPLGVLPLGTLNHFADALGIPEDLAGAARIIAAGQVRRVDVGEVNGRVFVNNSQLGFYPPVVLERDRQREQRGSNKWVAAAAALVKVLPRVHALRLTLEIERRLVRRDTHFVFVGTSEYRMRLFTPGKRERLDDGHLYVSIVRRAGRLLLVRLALLSLVSDATRSQDFDSWCVPELTIEERHPRRRRIPVFLDGEVERLAPPLRYRSLPRALAVLAPPPAE
jgi:diacylglycerol kinase family enzyme